MQRWLVGACAVAFVTLPAPGRTAPAAVDLRGQPMQFQLRLEGPAEVCGSRCRIFVSAAGAISSETPREFDAFAKSNNVRGAMLVLDSDGGSVLGALALGRAVRKLQMTTMVGRLIDLDPTDSGAKRSALAPRAYCESMCAFVLLAGVKRYVPAEARVLVHQIWLGDRRDDPAAANYSAEDLVLVQRDIGRLAQYTVEMGGGINLLETALRIPPWEPMRALSRDELRGMNIITFDETSTGALAKAAPTPALASGTRAAIGDRTWVLAERSDAALLTRKHPLTIEGDDIGDFELSFSCADAGKVFNVSYTERRRVSGTARAPSPLTGVELYVQGQVVVLDVVSSGACCRSVELESVARGRVPADVIKDFADVRSRSLTVETTNDRGTTSIRIGNVGVAHNLPKLADRCVAKDAVRSTALTPGKIAADQPR